MNTKTWTIVDAAAKLDEVIDSACRIGPQTITRNGHPVAVVASAEKRQQKTRREGSLADFFASSPLRGSGLVIERND
jgi:prevent-host-death family protein